jgi:hypothetical protein
MPRCWDAPLSNTAAWYRTTANPKPPSGVSTQRQDSASSRTPAFGVCQLDWPGEQYPGCPWMQSHGCRPLTAFSQRSLHAMPARTSPTGTTPPLRADSHKAIHEKMVQNDFSLEYEHSVEVPDTSSKTTHALSFLVAATPSLSMLIRSLISQDPVFV